MNITLITTAIAAVLGFAAGYQWQADNITSMELQHEQQQVSNARASFQKLELDSARVTAAQTKAKVRRAGSVVARNRSDNDASGLRLTATSAVQASSNSLDACNATADTLRTVFGACVQEFVGMAEIADGHHSDTLTLQEAWPK